MYVCGFDVDALPLFEEKWRSCWFSSWYCNTFCSFQFCVVVLSWTFLIVSSFDFSCFFVRFITRYMTHSCISLHHNYGRPSDTTFFWLLIPNLASKTMFGRLFGRRRVFLTKFQKKVFSRKNECCSYLWGQIGGISSQKNIKNICLTHFLCVY